MVEVVIETMVDDNGGVLKELSPIKRGWRDIKFVTRLC
jgi:hypothetical protein